MAEVGKFLTRTSPMGDEFIGECAPSCEHQDLQADNDTALINALNDTEVNDGEI